MSITFKKWYKDHGCLSFEDKRHSALYKLIDSTRIKIETYEQLLRLLDREYDKISASPLWRLLDYEWPRFQKFVSKTWLRYEKCAKTPPPNNTISLEDYKRERA